MYVHDDVKLGAYLDRLQHIAGNKPLVLGEYGIDSLRHGEPQQTCLLSQHVQRVFRHGLAGSFVFAYTDDWFTGGHQIEDWAFGVTRRDRAEKPSAAALRQIWEGAPHAGQATSPRVSVVVCSYNGAATLRECLDSLMRLDYPDYEVILVDDGSQDDTREIAQEFPQVVYYHQENHGLSVARNVGARLATGEIVAYTDSDCVVDEHWLRYLADAMQDQQVEAIGGPNITPPSDGWVAKCVAVSPGNPSHVMLDDRYAEHVPGCNMAFHRQTLLGLGGFDPQFRQAGDDVDMCWRLLDANLPIGYASGAMVWHHRRATVSAYARQQKGYGRSEAMVHFKHPQRFAALGRSRWKGIIYGDGAVGLPLLPDVVYHGRFGTGLFQTIYRHNSVRLVVGHVVAGMACGGLVCPAAGNSVLAAGAGQRRHVVRHGDPGRSFRVAGLAAGWPSSVVPPAGRVPVRSAADPARLSPNDLPAWQEAAPGDRSRGAKQSACRQADLRHAARCLLGQRRGSGTRGVFGGVRRCGEARGLVR